MSQKICLVVAFLFLGFPAFSQVPEQKASADDATKLREEAVEFLRESIADVGSLRTLENRISFGSEMASLMWFYDEKEAKGLFQGVIRDFRQLIAQYDAQLNALPASDDNDDDYIGGFSMFMPNRSERSRVVGDLSKAMSLRQQIALAIADHDAQFAYDFVDDTALTITNPAVRKQLSTRDASTEARLLQAIAEKDPVKALEKGRRSLSRGFNSELGDVLKKIYEKDPDKGADFAEEIVMRLKSETIDSLSASNLKLLLEMGASNLDKTGSSKAKRPMFREQSLREMGDLLAQILLRGKNAEEYSIESSISLIERFAPARASQVRAKFSPKKPKNSNTMTGTAAGPPPLATIGSTQGMGIGSSSGPGTGPARPERASALEDLSRLDSKDLPKEERTKIIESARKTIGAMKSREEKLMALTLLAGQVAKTGDKELAVEIMSDAQSLVNPSPRNYLDFAHAWMLTSGYAQVAPERAYPILDEAISKLNDTLSGFIKVAEFIDVNGEIVEEGEIQLGPLGGEMTREMMKMMGAADTTLIALARSDFRKMRALTNRFDRPEVRLLAKILILRSVLGPKGPIALSELGNNEIQLMGMPSPVRAKPN